VKYFIKVMLGVGGGTEAGDAYDDKKNCPNGRVWKISLNPDDPNAPIYTFEHPSELTSPYVGLANVNLTFGTLAPGALGQTTGGTITFDPSAAGHGWFIDSTPWDNAEYLPTHDPEIWVAREGSCRVGPAPPRYSPNPRAPLSDSGSTVPQASSYQPMRT